MQSPELKLAACAAQVRNLRAQLRANPDAAAASLAVKQFQSRRLSLTHADLLVHPRYGDAAKFFLFDLYGTKDFSQRDAELARVIPALQRFLPSAALAVIADAVQLDAISEELDYLLGMQLSMQLSTQLSTHLSTHLSTQLSGDHVLGQALSWSNYRAAYNAVNSVQSARVLRDTQMQLVMSIGSTLNTLVRKPLLGGLLKSMGPVALAAGVGTMHDFLSRGFTAYKAMREAQPFLQMIESREQSMHDATISQLSNQQVLQDQSLMGLA